MRKKRQRAFQDGACVVLACLPVRIARGWPWLKPGTVGRVVYQSSASEYAVAFEVIPTKHYVFRNEVLTLGESYLEPCPRRQVEIE